MALIVPGNAWINLSRLKARGGKSKLNRWGQGLGGRDISGLLKGGRGDWGKSGHGHWGVVTRKTSPCLKSRGVSWRETSSAMLRFHGRLGYRVAVKKTSVAKVRSRFISAARVRDLWYESCVPHTRFITSIVNMPLNRHVRKFQCCVCSHTKTDF